MYSCKWVIVFGLFGLVESGEVFLFLKVFLNF